MYKNITWNTGPAAMRARHNLKLKKNKKIKLKKLVLKLNKENAPPGGWSPRDKVSSSRRGGPAHKESGFKPSSLTGYKL